MFEFLRGIVADITPQALILDVNGMGFQIQMANPYRLTDKQGSTETIYVYHHVSQDSQLLYGFSTRDEKALFLALIKVSGIGPKSALAILANGDHDAFIHAVETSDQAYLMQFPGVGKKTAGQIVLDLQGKLQDFLSQDSLMGTSAQSQKNVALSEAMEALTALGYTQTAIKKVKKILDKEAETTTEEYLSQALKLLSTH